ncbi:Cupredoxin [Glonium stellatum]|uniref:Cupredoxin n=1 Tax=Glonium stellatum TaxID=574774 RepID=A0A8E2F3K8_9PEZI|nr:Cupredoxin [Glonium stellatum]
MLKVTVLLALGGFPLVLGQYGAPAGGGSSSASATPSATASANPNIHTVSVGQDGFVFTPNTTVASVGQQVEFQFFPPNHTVTQSSFENPCQPLSSTSFFSGFMVTQDSPGPQTFTVNITDTNPIWFYCAQNIPGDHCAIGMVGVINPPTSGPNTLEAFAAAAKKTNSSIAQPSVMGGVVASRTTSAPTSASSTGASAPKQIASISGIVSALAGFFALLLV